MANYDSNYTGQEVDEAIAKTQAIPTASDINDTVGRALKIPMQTPAAVEIVGVGTSREQVRVQIGSGLSLTGATSPYTLTTQGGGGGGKYLHNIQMYGVGDAPLYPSMQKHGFYCFLTVVSDNASMLEVDELREIIKKPTNSYAFPCSGMLITVNAQSQVSNKNMFGIVYSEGVGSEAGLFGYEMDEKSFGTNRPAVTITRLADMNDTNINIVNDIVVPL